jgi:hypothetical protein
MSIFGAFGPHRWNEHVKEPSVDGVEGAVHALRLIRVGKGPAKAFEILKQLNPAGTCVFAGRPVVCDIAVADRWRQESITEGWLMKPLRVQLLPSSTLAEAP